MLDWEKEVSSDRTGDIYRELDQEKVIKLMSVSL